MISERRIKVIHDLKEWSALREEWKNAGLTVGFVPTMGALHAGHGSLMDRAVAENDRVVVSIYVNPTQFNNPEDLKRYPQTLDADTKLAEKSGVAVVLAPNFAQMYPDSYKYRITENDLALKLEGAQRPGHFDGVLTVVMKLLNLVSAHHAYFGEKDFQQLELVKGMVAAFFLSVKIVACPTVREKDGLAMSSRNVHLDPSEREIAPRFASVLRESGSHIEATDRLKREGFEVEYVEDVGRRRLAAIRLGKVRLIDNVER
jgi:pantoate--beta-alanine ligase